MKLLADSVRQLSGTLTWKMDPPRSVRLRFDGGGTGCPGVPVDAIVPEFDPLPPPLLLRCASSPIERALGCCAKTCLTSWKSRLSCVFWATWSDRASWAMYCDRLPGFG